MMATLTTGIAQSTAGALLRDLADAARRSDFLRAIFADLDALRAEANHENWAGREGKAMARGAYLQARRLLQELVRTYPDPELTVDADGAVVMDWLLDRDHMLSLSVEESGRIVYAFHAGNVKGSRTDWYLDAVPSALATDLAKVTRDEAAGRRPERSGRPLPPANARPQATIGSDQRSGGEPPCR
ncbi:MAG: hypothetical protein ACRD1E_01050 [Terriglobales bacterium]